jgi:hypothetical protein
MNKERKKTISIIIIICCLLFIIGMEFKKISIMKKNVPTDILMTKLKFDWKTLPYVESKYTEFCIFLLEKYSKNMDREKRVQYIRQNWYISQGLSFEPFAGVALDYLETGLDPKGKHDYGEIGISGIKPDTALFALTIQKYIMPKHLLKYVFVDYRNKYDLSDPIISMKLKYTLLWYYRMKYDNMENWVISVYHWGGHVGKHFKIKKAIPVRFILDGINYNVLKYYTAYKEVLIAFNSGKLEPAVEARNRIRADYKRQCREEITFQNCFREIKRLQRVIANRNKKEKEFIESDITLEKELIRSRKEMQKISRESRAGGGKTSLRKVKDVALNLLKKLGAK